MGKRLIKVRGLVIPIDWDEKGDPVKTAIYGKDEERYIVESDKKGNELLRFLQQDLDIEGFLRKTKTGAKMITVTSYWHPLDAALFEGGLESNSEFDLN